MIKLSGITKSFADQVLLKDLTFNINRRERVGLVGRNGHGKTTLFKIILGQLEPDGGSVMIPRRYLIGHLDQHLRFSEDTILAEAALGLPENHRDETWKAEKILFGLGFTQTDMELPPAHFSGGFQVRLNLAKVLVSEPDLLLLDEPTNYLDVVSIRWLSRFLREWPSELMLITHDRSFMDRVATHIVAIHRKRARKSEGDTGKLYNQILQAEEIYEKTRLNDDKKRKDIERFITRFRAKNTLATRVQSRMKYLEKHKQLEKLDRIQTLDFSFNNAPFPAKIMMSIENLSFGYGPDPDLFTGLEFEVHSHDRICVIGQNGKGKTTLLRLLAGELTARSGTIQKHPKLALGHFAQTNVDTLHPNNNVVEEILSADGGRVTQTARNIAGAMMFEGDNALKRISILSGGEKSRVMLGKLIVSATNLLLLDEPTNHLDMDSCDSLLAAVDAFKGAVVIVTHNEMFLHTLATRFIVFDRGRVYLYDRSYRDFLEQVGWELDDTLKPARNASKQATRKPLDKKAMRQARAKLQQERTLALGPAQKRVERVEARITELESEVKVTDEALTEASTAGDAPAIAKLSRQSADIRRHINRKFYELELATVELDRVSAEFEGKLKDISS